MNVLTNKKTAVISGSTAQQTEKIHSLCVTVMPTAAFVIFHHTVQKRIQQDAGKQAAFVMHQRVNVQTRSDASNYIRSISNGFNVIIIIHLDRFMLMFRSILNSRL